MQPTRIAAITLSWDGEKRTLAHVLEMLDEAAAQRAQIACLPEECVPTDGGAEAQAALGAIAARAREHGMIVAANLSEREGGSLYSTSYLVGADGAVIGKYRKSHRMPDEEIALGGELPVFDTPYGKVGLMVGTDHYWPEIPLVMALKGAELILWSHGPEAVPQSYSLDPKMRVRALDDHVTLVCSQYAGSLPYLCSNYPAYTGEPLGRSCVIDRSGVVVADTGIHPGVAVAAVDLQRGKEIFHLTFEKDRGLFSALVDPDLKPAMPEATARRRIRVSLAQVSISHGPSPDPESPFLKVLTEACERGSDVVVMSEFGYATDTDEAALTFARVAELARKHRTYVVIGGLRDPEIPYENGSRSSWAYLWDRQGDVVGKYRISQYGLSVDLPVFRTDFGVVGLILCGDIYSQEICRSLALKGAEIVLCGSQSWGASGQYNLWMQQARAIDNGVYLATTHFPMSDHSQRSYVIDPYGYVLAATGYWSECVATAEVDLDAGQVWFARSDRPGSAGKPGYLAGYYPETLPEKRSDLRAVLFAGRRPELYGPITEATLADRRIPDDVKHRMDSPKQGQGSTRKA